MSLPIDTIICGDCKEILPSLEEDSIDVIVCDPPYELGFMGRKWDATGIAYDKDMWFGCLRVLKPGGHLLAFGGTRTYHRMACAIEDAGFEIRDMIEWVYGSGFPKSLDISKKLDQMAGAEREAIGTKSYAYPDTDRPSKKSVQTDNDGMLGLGFPGSNMQITAPSTDAAKQWAGFGSALKPAHEPICLARKPLDGCTIAENVIRWGVGGLNVDGCRIKINPGDGGNFRAANGQSNGKFCHADSIKNVAERDPMGRFPANLILDGSDEVRALFPETSSHPRKPTEKQICRGRTMHESKTLDVGLRGSSDAGSAARFFQQCPITEEDYAALFYQAKASKSERGEFNNHPTIKPLELMKYLCRLITPPGGLILDPFGGSGTTGLAAIQEGFHYILIEQQEEYCEIARKRISALPRRLESFA
jgi:site-specific DNA-methyltransferase (adenine-specific)